MFAAIVGSAGSASLSGSFSEADLDAGEAGLAGEQLQRLGHERLSVREVGVVVAQRERRERVDRLGDEQPARAQLGSSELEQAHEHGRRQMLDHLRREDAAERAVVEAFEVLDRVGLLDIQALATSVGDHVGVEVDPARLDPGLAQEAEELAAAAAQSSTGAASRKSSTYGRCRSRTLSVDPRMRLSKAK